MQYAPIIKEIGRGAKGARPMSEAQAESLFGDILDQRVPDLELGAILLSMRIKGEAADEVAGFKRAMDARTAQVAVPAGPRCVVLPTYNGARKQANLMPLVAMLLAQEGVPVLIQGRHDFESRVSPFELLAALGITPAASPEDAAAQLAEYRLACIALVDLCPGLDALLALRRRVGLRNSGHTLAKLLDPCVGRSVRVIAVTHPEYLDRMAEQLDREHACALLMRATEGEAYAHPRRRPRLLGYVDGAARVLFEQEESDPSREPAEGCSVADNAAQIRAMLAGTVPVPQPIRDQVSALAQLARA
ncbi:DNA-binding protein YbiB [Niveibacterium umoris]|uniref:Anthranilate phosphoribosyltransferase n=1 Tax=Niveibacterium umoris TaxID=1193620 RepID=A0A840BT80_9RHOO|nr:DNA-binding protein YbiB [Niveibacterium umoris]MBB4014728.1 anthranilate phosphoribosyltransferase [Niveibacterium umoris]